VTHILLTNDDGVHREGIRALRGALLAAGERVITVAPASNRSGVARALTIHDEVELRLLEPGDDPVYSCSGTPADCVRIGLLSDVAPDAVVVAGINHGINLGDDTGYSGTVGAAVEGASLGSCGVAFSQQGDDHTVGLLERGMHAFPLAPVAAAIAARVARAPQAGLVLNVNLPSRLAADRPLHHARLGRRFYPAGWLTSHQVGDGVRRFRPYAGLTETEPSHETAADVDFAVVLAGRIAVTPLAIPGGSLEAAPAWLEQLDLESVVRSALAAIRRTSVVRHPGTG
jgi:5'-nucleotidase